MDIKPILDNIGGISGAIVSIALVAVLLILIRSGSREKVLRGTLTYREFGFKGMKAVEKYERDTVKMTFNIEVRPDSKTLTIDTEGESQDVQDVTSVLNEILAAGAGQLTEHSQQVRSANRAHSRFEIVRRGDGMPGPAVQTRFEFTIIDRGEGV